MEFNIETVKPTERWGIKAKPCENTLNVYKTLWGDIKVTDLAENELPVNFVTDCMANVIIARILLGGSGG